MLVTANGIGVFGGKISFPPSGTWIADLTLDQPASGPNSTSSGFSDGTSVSIALGSGISISGTVQAGRNGIFVDAVHMRVVGGAGGLGKTATARAFVQPGAFVRDVVNALMSDSGETLSSTADAGFLAINLAAWHVTPRPVGQCLQLLIDIVNRSNGTAYNWRVLTDGTVWIGQETWPSASGTFDILEQNPADASWELGVESPFILPGTTLQTVGQIGRTDAFIEGGKLRQRVWQLVGGVDNGMAGALRTIVNQRMALIDYFGLYEATVVTQSGDGTTLDVQPVDKRFAGTQRIALRHGLPGVSVMVSPGAKILFGFKGGDPSQPFVHSWAGGETVLTLNVTASSIDIKANGNATVEATGSATIKGATATQLGQVGALPVLVQGTFDTFGIPVTQNPAASATTVLAG